MRSSRSLLEDCKGEGKLCEDGYYQKGTEFQETSLRPVISVSAHDAIRPLPVTPVQLMKPGIGRNASCALGDIHI